ncbi:hypothetical protein V1477_000337 [Vespula maculifrons]|uniref:Uncharacterized protein n=1 Tax=Vespula maculifrons TaxID=7453 RepID=A0ABD2D1D8_VESMC
MEKTFGDFITRDISISRAEEDIFRMEVRRRKSRGSRGLRTPSAILLATNDSCGLFVSLQKEHHQFDSFLNSPQTRWSPSIPPHTLSTTSDTM